MTADTAADILLTHAPQVMSEARSLLNQGVVRAQGRDFERAIACLSQSIQMMSTLAESVLQRAAGSGAAGGGATGGERVAYVSTISLKSLKVAVTQGYYYRGCTLCQMACYVQAIADFSYLISQSATSTERGFLPLSVSWLAAKRAEIYIHRGNAHRRLGNYSQALADLNQAVEHSNGSAQSYGCRGLLQLDRNAFEAAIADFDQALSLHPTFAQGYLWRGFARLRRGEPELAVADLTRAIAAIPTCAEAYNHRGVAYFQLSWLAAAQADFDQAIRIRCDFAEAYNNRGNLRQLRGDSVGAIADYDRSISLEPLLAELYFNRAAAGSHAAAIESSADAVWESQLANAAADYDATAGLPLDEPAFYRRRARVRSQRKDYRAAIADYTVALALAPSAWAYYQRGHVHLMLGEVGQAVADFDRAIVRSPDYGLPYCDRSALRFKAHDLVGALSDANQAILLMAHTVQTAQVCKEIYATRCLTHFCLGDPKRALEDFEQLVHCIGQGQSSSQTSKDAMSMGSFSAGSG
ncbi:MAG: tetratricopeptide repeat protein [Cyanobacteria bacterium J06631_12]